MKTLGRPRKYSREDIEILVERYESAKRGERADIATDLGIDLRSLRVYIYTWRKMLRDLDTEEQAALAIADTDSTESSVVAAGAPGPDVPF